MAITLILTSIRASYLIIFHTALSVQLIVYYSFAFCHLAPFSLTVIIPAPTSHQTYTHTQTQTHTEYRAQKNGLHKYKVFVKMTAFTAMSAD